MYDPPGYLWPIIIGSDRAPATEPPCGSTCSASPIWSLP